MMLVLLKIAHLTKVQFRNLRIQGYTSSTSSRQRELQRLRYVILMSESHYYPGSIHFLMCLNSVILKEIVFNLWLQNKHLSNFNLFYFRLMLKISLILNFLYLIPFNNVLTFLPQSTTTTKTTRWLDFEVARILCSTDGFWI